MARAFKFDPEFLDALIDAIDKHRSELPAEKGKRLASSLRSRLSKCLPEEDLLKVHAERSLIDAYNVARRRLSVEQANAAIEHAERRITHLKLYRRRPALSAQGLAEIYRSAQARAEEEGQE
ncbi:hypothetical protein [Rhizobium oryziradicis]|uniref:Uncharacterized protein n=1 Tax=Rhizobium oryziradicis TaxID=1867956 RepID=A0A1Q8ZQT7_9HYPH|nr:hypothetical protein [Rhizobium oryziradicis]OLP44433.1 hypothetical protein BJF95_07845 [Rhizobium oryziradicis]